MSRPIKELSFDTKGMRLNLAKDVLHAIGEWAERLEEIKLLERLLGSEKTTVLEQVIKIPTLQPSSKIPKSQHYVGQGAEGLSYVAPIPKVQVLQRKPQSPPANKPLVLGAAITFIKHKPNGTNTRELVKYLRAMNIIPKKMTDVSAKHILREILSKEKSIIGKKDQAGRGAGWRYFPRYAADRKLTSNSKVVTTKAKQTQPKVVQHGFSVPLIRKAITEEMLVNDTSTSRILTEALRKRGFPNNKGADNLSNLVARTLREMHAKHQAIRSEETVPGAGKQVFYTLVRPRLSVTNEERTTNEQEG